MDFIKKNRNLILLLILAILFFSATLTITWDSAHYLTYVDIFEGHRDFASWDIVRGPVFPLIITLGDKIFGKSAIGLLSLFFIIYLVYGYLILLIAREIFKNAKSKKMWICLFSIIASSKRSASSS